MHALMHNNNCIIVITCVGAFYFTIGNISPKYRSQLSAIQLLALVKSSFISTYGMDEILKPFVNMKKLVCKVNMILCRFIMALGARSRIHY